MIREVVTPLPDLYEADETAWLETMAELVRQGRREELDYEHLSEYLSDMATRERREVVSGLLVLLAHLLKWYHQSEKRTGGWKATILVQRNSLRLLAERGVLRKHAESVLAQVYTDAVELAEAETGFPTSHFPAQCPWTIDQLLAMDLTNE